MSASRVPARLIRTPSDEAALEQGCWFDPDAAERVRYFFRRFLKHSKGKQFAGKAFELLDWQWDRVVEPLFGWKMPDGTRRFRRCGIAVPKKNGKSTLLAGIGLYLLVGDNEPGAEVYSAGADRKQASIIFNEAANMVEASDALISRLRVKRAGKAMTYPAGHGYYEALSSDVPTKEGYNIHGLLFDELHAQPKPDLWNVLRYAGASREQPLIFWISTAGVDRESICYAQWHAAKAVQDGRAIDISLLPVIYETPDAADVWDPAVWAAANPSYGVTISERDMRESATEAKQQPAQENEFRRYRLNQWTRQVSRWVPMDRWDRCRKDYDAESLKRRKCTGGLDLATTTDLCAMVLLFQEGQKKRLLPYFWIPEGALRSRERSNRHRLDHWVRQGLIKATSGDVLDYDVVRHDINGLADMFRLKEIGIDPWNATQLSTDLQGDGFKVEYVRTGFVSISPATKELEKLVLCEGIEHNGHPVMDWCFNNMAVEQDASGNVKPSKKCAAEKIDGVVALLIALARAMAKVPRRSVYEDKGVMSL